MAFGMTREEAAARPEKQFAGHAFPSIHLRPAALSDARILFRWRNDPETRKWSFSHEEVSWDGHVAWLRRMLDDPLIVLFLSETLSGVPIAASRLTSQNEDTDTADLHVVVDAAHQGQGFGTNVIVATCRRAPAYGLRWLTARILEANVGSRAAFGRAGFMVEEITDGIVTMQRQAGS